MKLFSKKMLVFICVFFLVNVALKKLMFQEQTNSELIVSSLVVAVIVGLILFFKQKEKTSKDN